MKATKEKTWAEKTLEAIPEILKNTPMTQLLDQGLEGGDGGEYSSLPDLVLDEEFEGIKQEYELQEGNIKQLAKGLPEVFRKDIDKSLEEIAKIVLMERHEGARKMADILIRFYVRHHLGLDV
jgi:hypothetical protein